MTADEKLDLEWRALQAEFGPPAPPPPLGRLSTLNAQGEWVPIAEVTDFSSR